MDKPLKLPTTRKIRVLICDDHDLIRQALRAVIGSAPDMEVIGEAEDGKQAIALATSLAPDAVVMDIRMPNMSGVEATQRIKAILPNATILVLTVHDSYEYILSLLEAGATGYLTKGIITQAIPEAIRAATNGESILSEDILKKLLNYALNYSRNPYPSSPPDKPLTPRELEILALVATGSSNKMIARQLSLAENTVKRYMAGIFSKLQSRSRTEAVTTAQQLDLLPLRTHPRSNSNPH